MMEFCEWFFFDTIYGIGIIIVACIALFLFSDRQERKELAAQEASDMTLAHTASDTLSVRLHYRDLESQRETRTTMAVSAGIVAGSMAGRH
jgi:hypothetical protein